MAELRLDIVSKDGEAGEISSYFYMDNKDVVHLP